MLEQTQTRKDLLDKSLLAFKKIKEAETWRKQSLEDLKFTYNIDDAQWSDYKDKRKGRPCLVSNKIRKYVAQVANRERDSKLAMKCLPVDSVSDPITAQIYDGLLRQIEYQSNAETIYTDTGEKSLASGFGYFRILTQWEEDGFDQEIIIKGIDNQFSVYMDPRGNRCYIRDWMTNDEFEEAHEGATIMNFEDGAEGESWAGWYEEDKVHIAECFYKEPYVKSLVQAQSVSNPAEVKVFELTDKITVETIIAEGFQIKKDRKAIAHKIKWIKISGAEILDEKDWNGKHIPIVEVVGDKVNIEGKIYKRSLITDSKDPQKMYNYHLSTQTEVLALQPKAPYLVTPKMIAGHEPQWQTAHDELHPYLLYNSKGGLKPTRELPPQIQTGSMSLLQIADRDIGDTQGTFDASFGKKSNERTGRAINARAGRSDFSTYHWVDNYRRAIEMGCRIILDLIPRIYDTQRIVRIRGNEPIKKDLRGLVRNSIDKDSNTALIEINKTITVTGGTAILNDLSVGKYDIEASTRLYSNRRQEAAQQMGEVIQYAPAISPLLLPAIAKYQDWPYVEEFEEAAEIYKQMILQKQPKIGGQ